MRLSELLEMEVQDRDGRSLGDVDDVTVERRGDRWVITHLLVGSGGVAHRLGFVLGSVERPAAIAGLMRWMAQGARVVPRDKARIEAGMAIIEGRGSEFPHPEVHP